MNLRSLLIILGSFTLSSASAFGQYTPIYGAPTYNPATGTPIRFSSVYPRAVNNAGQTVVNAHAPDGTTTNVPIRLNGSGTPLVLNNVLPNDVATAINASGQVAGQSTGYLSGRPQGNRAVRWESNGTGTELGILGVDITGYTTCQAWSINDTGQIAGTAWKFVDGVSKGQRAVRWETDGTATELAVLGTTATGASDSMGTAINASGQVIGVSRIYVSGVDKGYRAVRWEANGQPTELGNLGTDATGRASARVRDINDAGQATGFLPKYTAGIDYGTRAVRWETNGAATELGILGTDSTGRSDALTEDINEAGQVAGYTTKYLDGLSMGSRAVLWNAAGAVVELDNLGTSSTGYAQGDAVAINHLGDTVGWVEKYDPSGTLLGNRAVLWRSGGTLIDLNSLIDPASGWTLTKASAISDNGWIAGVGAFDPDGAGPLTAYDRAFLMQVPEPSSLALLVFGALPAFRRRK